MDCSCVETVLTSGAGSVFEALSHGRPLIVVPNPLLMDNHQAELGKHLADLQHLVRCARSGPLRWR